MRHKLAYMPLSYTEALRSMECVAKGLRNLHLAIIVHIDLKASKMFGEFIL
jgi:hypothetical protein